MTNLALSVSIQINVPKTIVWNGLTNPILIKQYFFGTDARSDWKEGSSLTFSGVWEGKEYEDKGFILALKKEEYLKYNYWSSFSGKKDEPANYSNITYNLSENSGITTLTVTQDNIDTEEARKHSENNWQVVIKNLKDLLEKNRNS